MRFFFALSLLIFAGCADNLSRPAPGVALTRVWPGWRDADSFRRISEYFSGRENSGGEVVRRTQPEERGGYYFLARVQNPGNSRTGDQLVVQVISPSNPEVQTYRFPVDLNHGGTVFDLGITGKDWPSVKKPALAWRLELHDAAGTVLSAQQSFLWAKPEK